MNISIGITSRDSSEDVKALFDAGATEFFCGMMPREWVEIYGYQISLNRREFPINHFESFRQLETILKKIHRLGGKLSVAFNAHYYIKEQYRFIDKYLKRLNDLGIDSLIVADLGLLLKLKEEDFDFNIFISGEAGVYNAQNIKFYKEMGARRILFPRHLTIKEIEKMVNSTKSLGLEYEVFIMAERCPYNSDCCTTSHGWTEMNFCFTMFDKWLYRRFQPEWLKLFKEKKEKRIEILKKKGIFVPFNEQIKWKKTSSKYEMWKKIDMFSSLGSIIKFICGLCAIGRFKQIGIHSLKIPSRGRKLEERLEMIRLVKDALDSNKRLFNYCRNFAVDKNLCDLGYLCYYPNVL